MADDNNTTFECEQGFFEEPECVEIEIVGGLV